MTADLTKTNPEILMPQSSSKPSAHLDTDCKKDIWTAVTVSLSLLSSMQFCFLCTRVFDRGDTRTMKFDDFIQCCVMLRSLTEGFKRLDSNRSGVVTLNYEQVSRAALTTLDLTLTSSPVVPGDCNRQYLVT